MSGVAHRAGFAALRTVCTRDDETVDDTAPPRVMGDFEYIERSDEGDFAVVTMCRPKSRNALSEAHLRELLAALRDIGDGSQRGVIVAAQGPVFSAGHDFSDMHGRDLEATRLSLERWCAVVLPAAVIGLLLSTRIWNAKPRPG